MGIVFEKIVLLAQRKVSSVFERMGPITLGRHYLVKPSTDYITYVQRTMLAKINAGIWIATLFYL